MASVKNKLLFLTLLLLVLSLGASFVLAQEKNLETQYPTVPGAETPITTKTPLPQYVKYVFNFSIALAGLVAFISLVYGGVRYLTSAGSATAVSEAKKQIFAGILGLIILLSSYMILNTINPQLLFFDILKPDVGEAPSSIPPLPLKEQTLYAEEIPLGALIDGIGEKVAGGSATSPVYTYEGVLAKTRLERLIELSEDVWTTSKKVQKISKKISDASQELAGLAQQCVCANCSAECGGCSACPCDSSGDPCGPVRDAIKEQQTILSVQSAELLPFKEDLRILVKKVKLEKEKLDNALAELEKAERMMKVCSSSVSEQNKTNVLLTSNSFGKYKEGLEKDEIIKKMEIKKEWEHIRIAENDETTFYCAETTFEVLFTKEVNLGETVGKLTPIEGTQASKTFCGIPIPIGEIIDNSEDIAGRASEEMRKMIAEMEKIIEEIPKESGNAENLAPLPECRQCAARCSCECSPITQFSTTTGAVCIGCHPTGSFSGNPCPEEKAEIENINALIQENHQIIDTAYGKITVSDDEIHNLIDGNEVHDEDKKREPPPNGMRKPTWAYKIIGKELPDVRISFAGCHNTAEEWENFLSGQIILTKSLLVCDQGREICEDIEKDYECYGENDADAYPNYFCTETKSK